MKIGEKKLSLSSLDKKLWKIFSEYIRLRDADSDGNCVCISCGKMHHWKETHAGHYITRKYKSVKFNEYNVNAQCCSCNTFYEGNAQAYRKGLLDKYGKNAVTELESNFSGVCKLDRNWYSEKIEEYTNLLKELKKVRGIV